VCYVIFVIFLLIPPTVTNNIPSNIYLCARNWRLSEQPHFPVYATHFEKHFVIENYSSSLYMRLYNNI